MRPGLLFGAFAVLFLGIILAPVFIQAQADTKAVADNGTPNDTSDDKVDTSSMRFLNLSPLAYYLLLFAVVGGLVFFGFSGDEYVARYRRHHHG